MTTLLILAHAPLASALRAVAQHAFPDCAAQLQAQDVAADSSPEQVVQQARALLALQPGESVLVLTDAYGATPCNAAIELLDDPQVRVVAGVNVPMLWRTLCYAAKDPLDALVARALAGAAQGVMQVTAARPPQPCAEPGCAPPRL